MTRPRSEVEPKISALFQLTGRVAIVTGGGGLLGARHAEAIAEMGGHPVVVDIDGDQARTVADRLTDQYGVRALGLAADITSAEAVRDMVQLVLDRFGTVDILINNAAHNPKQERLNSDSTGSRLEHFSLVDWHLDMAVGLTGAFLCSRQAGIEMARQGHGVILNIASDLGVIAPDQRIYHQPHLPDAQQPAKPVSYSVVKHGLIGLTRYLATYWADRGIRVNALSPGGVYTGQDEQFVKRLVNLIPMGRMAQEDEY